MVFIMKLIISFIIIISILITACSQQVQNIQASGQGVLILDFPADAKGKLSVFEFSKEHMLCASSFSYNNSVADLGGEGNFGIVVYSQKITDFKVERNNVIMKGKAQSVTYKDGNVLENAEYDFTVIAIDNGDGKNDLWNMTLYRKGLMFDGVSFGTSSGLIKGDIKVDKNRKI